MTTPNRSEFPLTLRVLCNDEKAAQLFETCLLNEGVYVSGTDGRDVLVPWGGDARFALWIGELAARHGFAADDLTPITRQIALSSAVAI